MVLEPGIGHTNIRPIASLVKKTVNQVVHRDVLVGPAYQVIHLRVGERDRFGVCRDGRREASERRKTNNGSGVRIQVDAPVCGFRGTRPWAFRALASQVSSPWLAQVLSDKCGDFLERRVGFRRNGEVQLKNAGQAFRDPASPSGRRYRVPDIGE